MYILTGGAGFIGSCFLSTLNQKGIDDILIVDCLDKSPKWKNLVSKRFNDYIDCSELFTKLPKLNNVKAVIHLGAISSTTESDSNLLMQNNYQYTRQLAEWCLANSVRFIYASSAATYGAGEHGYSDDLSKLQLFRPLNMYGYSKQLFDSWADRAGALSKIAGFKFFNVYGPNEYHKAEMSSVVYKSFKQIEESGRVRLFKSYNPNFKDGEQQRDFIYVKDCSDVLYWFLNNPNANGLFNLGSGIARSWNDLCSAVFKALNKPVQIEYIDMPAQIRDQYQYYTKAEIKLLSQSGCSIKFQSLEDGIKDYVLNYLKKPGAAQFL